MKRYMILVAWIAGILFPLAWVGKLLPGVRSSFGPIVRPYISPEWVHVVVHTALFAGLVLLLAFTLRLKRNLWSFLFLVIVVAAFGLGQEGLQLVAKGRSFGWPEMFDLVVDMLGGLLGWLLWGIVSLMGKIRIPRIPEY